MNVRNRYFVRIWKHGIDDPRPLYAGWIYAHSASEATRKAADSWSDQPVDFALITIDKADQSESLSTVRPPGTIQ
jgi:hypothetical protein